MGKRFKVVGYEQAAEALAAILESDSSHERADTGPFTVVEGRHPSLGQCTVIVSAVSDSVIITRDR